MSPLFPSRLFLSLNIAPFLIHSLLFLWLWICILTSWEWDRVSGPLSPNSQPFIKRNSVGHGNKIGHNLDYLWTHYDTKIRQVCFRRWTNAPPGVRPRNSCRWVVITCALSCGAFTGFQVMSLGCYRRIPLVLERSYQSKTMVRHVGTILLWESHAGWSRLYFYRGYH